MIHSRCTAKNGTKSTNAVYVQLTSHQPNVCCSESSAFRFGCFLLHVNVSPVQQADLRTLVCLLVLNRVGFLVQACGFGSCRDHFIGMVMSDMDQTGIMHTSDLNVHSLIMVHVCQNYTN